MENLKQLVAFLTLVLLWNTLALGQSAPRSHWIVEVTGEQRAHLPRAGGFDWQPVFPGGKWWRLQLDKPSSRRALEQKLRGTISPDRIWPDLQLESRSIPNDPLYSSQWNLHRIGLPEAWSITTGGTTALGDTIVVAVIDQGFDLTHPDIRENLWYNSAELPGDGIDNDQNGLIDDRQGWNFADGQPQHRLHPHGLWMAGLIGASTQNTEGLAGINWQIRILPLTVDRVSDLLAAYDYLIRLRESYRASGGKQGALVVVNNSSLGLPDPYFCRDFPLWGAMYDSLGKAGILTAAGAPNRAVDVDRSGDMPSSCPSPFLLTSLHTDEADHKYAGSGYGKRSIDLGVPGERVPVLHPNSRYSRTSGNSVAAAQLAGAIALLYSWPNRDFAQLVQDDPAGAARRVRRALLEGGRRLPQLGDLTYSGALLDLPGALDWMEKERKSSGIPGTPGIRSFPNPFYPARGKALSLAMGEHERPIARIQVLDPGGRAVAQLSGPTRAGRLISIPDRFFAGRGGIYWIQVFFTDGESRATRVLVLP